MLTCRAPCRLWWRKQWRHVYLRYLTSSSDVILFRCLFLLCVDIDYMLPLLVLYSSMLPLPLLYSSGHATLLVVFIHYFLPPSQTTEPPAPVLSLAPSPSGPPSQLVPRTSPNRDPQDFTARRFWLVHTLYILLALFLVHSVCFSALTSCHFTIYICVDVGLCFFCSFYLGSVICYNFSPSTFPRRPGRMWTNLRNRWPPNEGPPLPRHPPNLRPNDPDWTVPHLWQDL